MQGVQKQTEREAAKSLADLSARLASSYPQSSAIHRIVFGTAVKLRVIGAARSERKATLRRLIGSVESTTVAQIVRATKWPTASVNSLLTELERDGHIERLPGRARGGPGRPCILIVAIEKK